MKPVVAVSLGDPAGIGPEVTAAALASASVRRALVPIVFGDDAVYARACHAMNVDDRLVRVASAAEGARRGAPCLVPVTTLNDARPGRPTRAGAFAQLAYLEAAVDALEAGHARALCTAPLSKEQVSRTGRVFSGHTEYLAERFGARVLMLLAGPTLRVAIHTTHVAIADVARRLDEAEIVRDLSLLHDGLGRWFDIPRPRIGVCGLNPHAGDGGLFGDEEARVIAPAVARARRKRIDVRGPFAADGLFPIAAKGGFDAVLAMYHDQGLVPLKLLDFDRAVNVTLGLPIPRTSPDHGVAYDLAGRGTARFASMREAALLAARLASARDRAY